MMYIVVYCTTVGHNVVNNTLTTNWKSTIHIVCSLQSAQKVGQQVTLNSVTRLSTAAFWCFECSMFVTRNAQLIGFLKK